MKENERILCSEEILRELEEIQKAVSNDMEGEKSNLGMWTDSPISCFTIICC